MKQNVYAAIYLGLFSSILFPRHFYHLLKPMELKYLRIKWWSDRFYPLHAILGNLEKEFPIEVVFADVEDIAVDIFLMVLSSCCCCL